jgi:hypothetical protein
MQTETKIVNDYLTELLRESSNSSSRPLQFHPSFVRQFPIVTNPPIVQNTSEAQHVRNVAPSVLSHAPSAPHRLIEKSNNSLLRSITSPESVNTPSLEQSYLAIPAPEMKQLPSPVSATVPSFIQILSSQQQLNTSIPMNVDEEDKQSNNITETDGNNSDDNIITIEDDEED